MSCESWACDRLDDDGICEETGSECIGDLCEDFQTCESCGRPEEECPE